MTRDEVRTRLVSLVHEIAKIPPEEVTESATLDDQIQLESVAFVELQVAIEEEFDILIDPIQVVELNEFGAIVDYIHECAVGQAS